MEAPPRLRRVTVTVETMETTWMVYPDAWAFRVETTIDDGRKYTATEVIPVRDFGSRFRAAAEHAIAKIERVMNGDDSLGS